MNAFQVLKKLQLYPTFSVATITNILHADSSYAKLYINRLKHRELIFQLQRNVYTVHSDPLTIASHIIWPSYISLWAALRYHDLTEQIPTTIAALTTRFKRRTEISFGHTTITFKHIPPRWFFGYEKVKIGDFDVIMAEPEKALIDALLLKALSATEVYAILQEHVFHLSTNKLITYTLRTQNKALIKRMGWMLCSQGITASKRLQKLTYPTMIPFDYARPPTGRKDRTWGLILNMRGA